MTYQELLQLHDKRLKEIDARFNLESPNKEIMVCEYREDGYSKSFIFLYIITSFSYTLGYTLKELFSEDAKALPTLRKTAPGEKPQYTLFNKFNYNKKD